MARTPKCHYCDQPGEYRGWIFEMRTEKLKTAKTLKDFDKLWKKIIQPMCEAHLLVWQFQIMPYRCVRLCEKNRMSTCAHVLEPQDMIMYFPLSPILGGVRPKCGWCGRRLRQIVTPTTE